MRYRLTQYFIIDVSHFYMESSLNSELYYQPKPGEIPVFEVRIIFEEKILTCWCHLEAHTSKSAFWSIKSCLCRTLNVNLHTLRTSNVLCLYCTRVSENVAAQYSTCSSIYLFVYGVTRWIVSSFLLLPSGADYRARWLVRMSRRGWADDSTTEYIYIQEVRLLLFNYIWAFVEYTSLYFYTRLVSQFHFAFISDIENNLCVVVDEIRCTAFLPVSRTCVSVLSTSR